MIIEIAVFWIFVIECWFALWAGKTVVKLETINERLDEMADIHKVAARFGEVDNSFIKISEDKVATDSKIQSNTDKINDIKKRLNKLEEPKTDCKCSSDDVPYNKGLDRKIDRKMNDVELELETLYDYLGIKKEYFICPDCLEYAKSIEDARDYKFVKDKK